MSLRFLAEDASLIRRLRKGEIKAFELIFSKYKEKLYFFVLGYVHSPAETEEIIQNLFVALWENRSNLNEVQSLKCYLYKAVTNKVYNYFKHQAVQNKFVEQMANQHDPEEDHSLQHLYYNDLKDTINTLIDSLPVRQQMIFRLSRNQGLSHQEIADHLGLSVRSIENQVYRALKSIREGLKEQQLITK